MIYKVLIQPFFTTLKNLFLDEIFLTHTEKSSTITNTPGRPSGISITEIVVGTHFDALHVSKFTTIFLHDDDKAPRLLLTSPISGTGKTNYVTRKHLFLFEKTKKGQAWTVSPAITNIHLSKPFSTVI